MWQLFIKGGIVMYPLAVCSIIGLIIVIERILFFSRTARNNHDLLMLKKLLSQGQIAEAKKLTVGWNSATGRVAARAITQGEINKKYLETVVQSAGEMEVSHLQRGLNILDTIVTASPLLGLLGTVIGIIKTFVALSITSGQSAQLSAGIAEALYNTAFGLSIAIPALFFVNVFYGIAEKKARELNSNCEEIMIIFEEGS